MADRMRTGSGGLCRRRPRSAVRGETGAPGLEERLHRGAHLGGGPGGAEVHAAAGGQLEKTGKHLESMFPQAMQLWLYRLAIDRGHLDTILDRGFVEPLLALSRLLGRLDRIGLIEQRTKNQEGTMDG